MLPCWKTTRNTYTSPLTPSTLKPLLNHDRTNCMAINQHNPRTSSPWKGSILSAFTPGREFTMGIMHGPKTSAGMLPYLCRHQRPIVLVSCYGNPIMPSLKGCVSVSQSKITRIRTLILIKASLSV